MVPSDHMIAFRPDLDALNGAHGVAPSCWQPGRPRTSEPEDGVTFLPPHATSMLGMRQQAAARAREMRHRGGGADLCHDPRRPESGDRECHRGPLLPSSENCSFGRQKGDGASNVRASLGPPSLECMDLSHYWGHLDAGLPPPPAPANRAPPSQPPPPVIVCWSGHFDSSMTAANTYEAALGAYYATTKANTTAEVGGTTAPLAGAKSPLSPVEAKATREAPTHCGDGAPSSYPHASTSPREYLIGSETGPQRDSARWPRVPSSLAAFLSASRTALQNLALSGPLISFAQPSESLVHAQTFFEGEGMNVRALTRRENDRRALRPSAVDVLTAIDKRLDCCPSPRSFEATTLSLCILSRSTGTAEVLQACAGARASVAGLVADVRAMMLDADPALVSSALAAIAVLDPSLVAFWDLPLSWLESLLLLPTCDSPSAAQSGGASVAGSTPASTEAGAAAMGLADAELGGGISKAPGPEELRSDVPASMLTAALMALDLCGNLPLSALDTIAGMMEAAVAGWSRIPAWEMCFYLLFFHSCGVQPPVKLLDAVAGALDPATLSSNNSDHPNEESAIDPPDSWEEPQRQRVRLVPASTSRRKSSGTPPRRGRGMPMRIAGALLCAFGGAGHRPPSPLMRALTQQVVQQLVSRASLMSDTETIIFGLALCSFDPGPALLRLTTARLRATVVPPTQSRSHTTSPFEDNSAIARGGHGHRTQRRASVPAPGLPSTGFAALGDPTDTECPLAVRALYSLAKLRHQMDTSTLNAFCRRLEDSPACLSRMCAEDVAYFLCALGLLSHHPGATVAVAAVGRLSDELAACPRALCPRDIVEVLSSLATLNFCPFFDPVAQEWPDEGDEHVSCRSAEAKTAVGLLIQRFAEKAQQQATREDLIRCLRALAVVGAPQQACHQLDLMVSLISTGLVLDTPPSRSALADLHLLIELGNTPRAPRAAAAAASVLAQRPALRSLAAAAFRARTVSKRQMLGPLQGDVSSVLVSMGILHVRQMVSDDGGPIVAIAILDYGIAVEVEDGDCALRNVSRPCGYALLHRRMVSSRGWRVVPVCSWEWDRCHTLHQRQQLLVSKLTATVLPHA